MKRSITQVATIIIIAIALVLAAVTYVHKYKRDADRKACALNIRNMHQATRAHCGLNSIDIGAPIDWSEIFTSSISEGYLEEPTCPYDGSRYILQSTHPPFGVPAAECPHCDTLNHRPDDTTGW